MTVKCLNDVFKLLSNYGATEQQFFFVVDFLSSYFKKWNINDFSSNCIKQTNCIAVKKDDNKGFYIDFFKNYYDVMLVDNSAGITLYYCNKKLNITICDYSKKEVYFVEILRDGITISYYDESGYELGKKQEEYLHLRLKPFKNMLPKITCHLDSDEGYNDFLEKLGLMKNATLKTALFYYDDDVKKIKVL